MGRKKFVEQRPYFRLRWVSLYMLRAINFTEIDAL